MGIMVFAVIQLLCSGAVHALVLEIDSGTAEEGIVLAIPVTLSASGGDAPAAVLFDVQFDTNLLHLDSVELGDVALNAGKSLEFNSTASGITLLVGGVNENAIADGVLLTLNLISGTAAKSLVALPLTGANGSAADPTGEAIPVSFDNGQIEADIAFVPIGGYLLLSVLLGLFLVLGMRYTRNRGRLVLLFLLVCALSFNALAVFIAGDFNSSGAVDTTDLNLLVARALGQSNDDNTDIDYSGTTDAVDYQLVVRILLGYDIDADDDGLADVAEINLGTLPNNPDSDDDGLNDGDEVVIHNTNPRVEDSDNDGLTDGDEVNVHGTIPTNPDTDGDDLDDGEEVNTYGTEPNEEDTDGDGVNDGAEVALGEDPNVFTAYIRINEFVSANDSGLQDEDGAYSDWIELYNPSDVPVSLEGWRLSDDSNDDQQWTFPAVTIPAESYLVVFASGQDRVPTDGSNLHTNFSLGSDGEFLALYNSTPDTPPIGQFSPDFPTQVTDHSYAFVADEYRYFETPTPGGPNVGGVIYDGLITDTNFSVDRGFYDTAFDVIISADVPGVSIRYTTDGTEPTPTSGTIYSGPVSVSGTTTLRAIAYRDGWLPSNVDTQTYLFLDDVLTQSPNGESPGAGWPSGDVNGQYINYGMDPDIINDPRYDDQMLAALTDIPSISLVTDIDYLFDPATGIYVNARDGQGRDWERPTSVELINPDGSKGFQVNAGLRIRGGWSRNDFNPKHAFRLFFRDEYGVPKLKYPLFGDEGADEFDNIDLRTSQNYSWSSSGDERNTMNRDVFSRDAHRDMGEPYTRSRYYHLYVNGQYWGLFQSEERGEASFGETYFGGIKEDYDVVKAENFIYETVPTDGNLDDWQALWDIAVNGFSSDNDYYFVQGLDPDGTPNPAFEVMVDVDNLITYMLITYYGGNLDAPISNFLGNNAVNNFSGIRDRNGNMGWQFMQHDAEHTLLNIWENRTGPYPAGDAFLHFNPQWLHQQMINHPRYRMHFMDRVYREFYNEGALTPAANVARFMSRADEINLAIIAESARWGDASSGSPLNKDDHWTPALNNIVNNYFPGRSQIVVDQFKAQAWYPNTEPPVYNQRGGQVAVGFNVTMTAPSGSIYYTLDGSDPAEPSTIIQGADEILLLESAAKEVLIPGSSADLSSASGLFDVTVYAATNPVESIADVVDVMTHPDDQISILRVTDDVINYLNTGDVGNFGSDDPFPGTTIGVDADRIVVYATASVDIPAAGAWTFGVNSDDGFILRMGNGGESFETSYDGPRGAADTLERFYFSEAGVYQLELGFFENGGGSSLELFAAQGEFWDFASGGFQLVGDTANGGLGLVRSWIHPDFDTTGWTAGNGGVGYDATSTDYDAYISTDVIAMSGVNTSCLIRIPFTLASGDLDDVNQLTLSMRYDDGFVAFLNGVPVAQANAPQIMDWDSEATAGHNDVDAVNFVDFDLTDFAYTLRTGDNLLAIHALNAGVGSSDMLASVELTASSTQIIPGAIGATAQLYSGAVPLSESAVVRARALDGGEWSAVNEVTFAVGPVADNLRITEIMYRPQDAPDGNPDAEFVELMNIGPEAINLGLVEFTNGIDFSFPSMSLAAGEYVVVIKDQVAFEAVYGAGLNVAGVYGGSLNNGGERVVLADASGAEILNFKYNDNWYDLTDGMGFSLTLIDATNPDLSTWENKSAWRPSSLALGTPGAADGGEVPAAGAIVINEILAHSHAAAPDWIEIHNTTASLINIGGWFLSDSSSNRMKYEIPPGTSIAAGAYMVFYEDIDFGDGVNPDTPFALSENGETVYLSSGLGGVLTGYSDEESFGASAEYRYVELRCHGDQYPRRCQCRSPGGPHCYQ
jgi:hypothetical protein